MFRIIEKLGGIDATLEILQRRRGVRLTRYAVEFWEKNKSIPAINVLPLMEECKTRGVPFDMSDFQRQAVRKSRKAS